MELGISVREAIGSIDNLFNREITNYPASFNRDFVSSRGRSYGRGEAPWVYQNVYQVWQAQAQSRLLLAYNEFAQCATENRVNYVTGEEGFGVQAVPQNEKSARGQRLAAKVNEFLMVFEELNAIDDLISESMFRLDSDGEFFLRLFFGRDGLTRLRFVEPEHVYYNGADTSLPTQSFGIENPENDVVNPVAYWIAPKPWISPETTRVEEKYVVHCKLNAKANQKRGWPVFLSVGPNLLRCEDLLGSMTQIARTRAKIAMVRKLLNVTKDTASSLLDQLTKKKVTTDEGVNVNIEDFQPGTVLTAGSSTEYQFPEYKFGADDFVEVLQAELRTIAARFKMPEWMLTALADAKYNNAFVVESTATKEFSRLQRKLQKAWVTRRVGHYRSVYWRAVLHAVEVGILPQETVTQVKLSCNGPIIVTRDLKQEADINKTYFDMGLRDGASIQREQGIKPDEVRASRAIALQDGSLTIPLDTVAFIQQTLGAIKQGQETPEIGYRLIANVLGVSVEVVKEVYPVQVTAAPSANPEEMLNALTVQEAWDENKHPRADDGKFGSGGGGAKKGEPKEDKPKEDKPKETSPEPKAKKTKATPEQKAEAVTFATDAIKNGLKNPVDAKKLAEHLHNLTVKEIDTLKRELKTRSGGKLKQDRVDRLVAFAKSKTPVNVGFFAPAKSKFVTAPPPSATPPKEETPKEETPKEETPKDETPKADTPPEPGFTGKDSLGREWVNGKLVSKPDTANEIPEQPKGDIPDGFKGLGTPYTNKTDAVAKAKKLQEQYGGMVETAVQFNGVNWFVNFKVEKVDSAPTKGEKKPEKKPEKKSTAPKPAETPKPAKTDDIPIVKVGVDEFNWEYVNGAPSAVLYSQAEKLAKEYPDKHPDMQYGVQLEPADGKYYVVEKPKPVKIDTSVPSKSTHSEFNTEYPTLAFKKEHPHAGTLGKGDKGTVNPTLPDATRPPVADKQDATYINNYSWGYDGPMNRALRDTDKPPPGDFGGSGDKLNVNGPAMFASLQKQFKAAKPFKPPVKVFRGIKSLPESAVASLEAAARKAMKSGGAATMPGFISTSTKSTTADSFTGPVAFEIEAIHGVDIKPYSHFPSESELLLNHNTKFKVTDVGMKHGRLVIKLSQLQPEDSTESVAKLDGK